MSHFDIIKFILFVVISFGLIKIIFDSYQNISKGRWSLDYIAFAAMGVSLLSGEFLAGAVIAIMFTGGEALEAFASRRAVGALKKLSETIPKNCLVRRGSAFVEVPIQDVRPGEKIIVKPNEIIALDGIIVSPSEAILNMSNLTGEAEALILKVGTFVKSGAINIGGTVELSVVGDFSSSTYHKIAELVEVARANPSRTVRISEKANYYFTAISFFIAALVYLLTGEISRLLAVLVIATPCPLIIAAPVAFVGGMSKVARSGIILRKPAAFESVATSKTIFFDKTGTLTLGVPVLHEIEIIDSTVSSQEALSFAASLEINSLHPLGKAIVEKASERHIKFSIAEDVSEKIGVGISGTVNGNNYSLRRAADGDSGIILSLFEKELSGVEKEITRFHFRDMLKTGAAEFILDLKNKGIKSVVITGDKTENSKKVFAGFGIDVYAEKSPEDKYRFVEEAEKNGQAVIMIGDGLNDALALALATVGVVFSGTENGASIEAADVVVLGSGIEKLQELFSVSERTVGIAKQSIYGGIILSVVGMSFAALGFIAPVNGAILQEVVDVAVILNALRTLI
ncbi:MAG: heavy metal translocating P-type ATPase [bacterium]